MQIKAGHALHVSQPFEPFELAAILDSLNGQNAWSTRR